MVIVQTRPKRKLTGSCYHSYRRKKSYEKGRLPAMTKLGEKKVKTIRIIGGNEKSYLMSTDTINVFDPKTKKHTAVKIKSITENTANRNFVRRNVMTKGTVVDTEKGKVKITSRPGQDPILNGVFVA
ncbi:30S ribosomal protein S8e [Candidatus Woesearchaeota archaeon]|nr:30S ribosomal protein S8e [Candidatus Woesearchaeota archaeon]